MDKKGFDQLATAKLEAHFELKTFRPYQLDVIRTVCCDRRDTMAVLPTGSGKSLLPQMISLLTDRVVIVVTPIKELMHAQQRAAAELGLRALVFCSTTPAPDQAAKDVRAGKYQLGDSNTRPCTYSLIHLQCSFRLRSTFHCAT